MALPLPTIDLLMAVLRLRMSPAGAARSFDISGLIWTLTRTDFKTRYHGTLGGFVWAMLKPTAMFVVLFSVFSFVFPQEASYRLDLVLGLFLFDFFSEGTKTGISSLYSKSFLLTKARFPSWIIVATSVSNAVITITVFSIVFMSALAMLGRMPGPTQILLYLFYLACLMLIVIGISLAMSVLFLRYRDLNQVWDVVIQAGFFLAPVVWPLRILPLKYHFYLYIWPPTPVIQFSREVLVDGTIPTLKAHMLLVMVTAVIFATGFAIFRRHAPRAAEYL